LGAFLEEKKGKEQGNAEKEDKKKTKRRYLGQARKLQWRRKHVGKWKRD
jgi:hypothetical protein